MTAGQSMTHFKGDDRRVLEKLLIAQVIQKCPVSYGTLFTRACHWSPVNAK